MHTMQQDDSAHGAGAEDSHGNGYLDISHGRDAGRQKGGPSLKLILAAVGGMLLPLLTQIGHAH
jgi:zinc transporter 9